MQLQELTDNYQYTLTGPVVPKARPRVTLNGTFMPHHYSEWKQDAVLDLMRQHSPREPIAHTSLVSIVLVGRHHRGSDADNIAGAILDALVEAGVLKGDNLKVVPSLALALQFDKAQEPTTIISLLG